MFTFPNSSAMDATASSGGPVTFLPRIVTGSPEQVAAHVTQLLDKAKQFVSLMDEFAKAEKQLSQVWTGKASESALKKISDSLSSFEKIIKVVEDGAKLLGVAGTLVKTAQEAYRTVVSAVNPTVAALMSTPWTHAAAVALSTATSASLRGFIEAIGGLLKTLGVVKLGTQLSSLASIIGELDKLFHGSKSASSTPATSTPAPTTPPVTAPQNPPPVASASGQQAVQSPGVTPTTTGGNSFTDYVPPALNGSSHSTTTYPANSWIPVDPAPTATPVHETIKVTTTIDGESTTVEVPTDHDVDINVDLPVHGQKVTEHITVTGHGKVAVQ